MRHTIRPPGIDLAWRPVPLVQLNVEHAGTHDIEEKRR